MDLKEIDLGRGEVDSFGSELGPVAGSCEYGDEPSGSDTTELVTEISYKNGNWMGLAQYYVQLWAFLLMVFDVVVLL
jgi:hypothetical protein